MLKLTFISTARRCGALVRRLAEDGIQASREDLDIPAGEYGQDDGSEVGFYRLSRLTCRLPAEMAVKTLQWASGLTDGTWTMVESSSWQDSLNTLLSRPDDCVVGREIRQPEKAVYQNAGGRQLELLES